MMNRYLKKITFLIFFVNYPKIFIHCLPVVIGIHFENIFLFQKLCGYIPIYTAIFQLYIQQYIYIHRQKEVGTANLFCRKEMYSLSLFLHQVVNSQRKMVQRLLMQSFYLLFYFLDRCQFLVSYTLLFFTSPKLIRFFFSPLICVSLQKSTGRMCDNETVLIQ